MPASVRSRGMTTGSCCTRAGAWRSRTAGARARERWPRPRCATASFVLDLATGLQYTLVHPSPSLRDRLFGNGLVIALTLVLSVAAVLAAVGLVLELTGARTVVVTQRPTTLVASQV